MSSTSSPTLLPANFGTRWLSEKSLEEGQGVQLSPANRAASSDRPKHRQRRVHGHQQVGQQFVISACESESSVATAVKLVRMPDIQASRWISQSSRGSFFNEKIV